MTNLLWVRWRWQHGFTFQPYTKYHLMLRGDRDSFCGRRMDHHFEPPWGNTEYDPPVEKRCKQCQRVWLNAESMK